MVIYLRVNQTTERKKKLGLNTAAENPEEIRQGRNLGKIKTEDSLSIFQITFD